MIVPIEKLGSYDFSLRDISAICQRPAYRRLTIKNRSYNGFLYLTEGNCVYSFGEQHFSMAPGALVYLPLNSRHVLDITSEEIEFVRINFTLYIGQEPALFSDHPVLLTDSVVPECAEEIWDLERHCRLEKNTVDETAKLSAILSYLIKAVGKPYSSRLTPAITYLQQHFTEQINCQHLAELCFLSTMQFYNLFHAGFGMTPLQYRNKLLADRACRLLRFGDISISEIAEMLGFCDAAYFSRFFKKQNGCTPKEYRNM